MTDPDPQKGRGVVGMPAQRERTVKILSGCFATNVLEMEEFERRVTAAHQARSVQELSRLIDDILEAVVEAPQKPPEPASSRRILLPEDEQFVYGIMMSDVKVRTR